MKDQRWTHSQARLTLFRRNENKKYNWLFLPGGPGFGSESLLDLVEILDLPGAMWLVDFPDDGSNISENENQIFSNWQEALVEVTSEFDYAILVAHSSGGMFALATPAIEKNLCGLVLMDTAPNKNWQIYFSNYIKENPIKDSDEIQKQYQENPSNELLKIFSILCAPYFATSASLQKIRRRLASLPFNYKSHIWTAKNFHPTYEAKWIPQKIPTLIFAGEQDPLTPIKLFREENLFHRKNIFIREIKDASHFPWMDNPLEVKQLFQTYLQILAATYDHKIKD